MSPSAPEVPDLSTPRLLIRRLLASDAPGLHQAYGDPAAMRFWDAPPSADVAETEARIARSLSVDPTWHATWAILSRAGGAFVGAINYHARQPWNRRLALGWILAPVFEGKGYMTEAARAVLDHCFGAQDTHRVEAEIEPENIRSIALAERLGFRREGLLRDRLMVASRPRSVLMFGLLSSDRRGEGAVTPPG